MDHETVVVCVYRTGGVYYPEYVKRLQRSAKLNGAKDFLCLTDDTASIMNFCKVKKLEIGYPGWWSKIELFGLDPSRQYLYLDLDTIINGNIRPFLEYKHHFTMLSGFSNLGNPASGVMAWSGDFKYILDQFDLGDIDKYAKGSTRLGDQGYITDALGFDPERFQDLFPGLITSRKKHTLEEREKSSIVCYHGHPRPHKVDWRI